MKRKRKINITSETNTENGQVVITLHLDRLQAMTTPIDKLLDAIEKEALNQLIEYANAKENL